MSFREPTTLGRTGLRVSRLGVGSSYGVPADALERAYHEYGVNYFYWGALRRGGMRDAIRSLARSERERIVIALQTYDRLGPLMQVFCERGLRALKIDRADVLILGWFNRYPGKRLVDAALRLREQGKVRFLALSSHHRPLFGQMAGRAELPFDVYMLRYNAGHRGAERDIFPHLPAQDRPGITAFTATRWGTLMQARKMPSGERPLTAAECYRFVLSNPNVDLCLAGPASREEMAEALRALEGGPLSEEELARARRIGDPMHG
jgi:aryl-alcohol dehydrogenase-like predicted oxidoreductase